VASPNLAVVEWGLAPRVRTVTIVVAVLASSQTGA